MFGSVCDTMGEENEEKKFSQAGKHTNQSENTTSGNGVFSEAENNQQWLSRWDLGEPSVAMSVAAAQRLSRRRGVNELR